MVVDYWANEKDVKKEYNIKLESIDNIKDADCIVLAVAHDKYKNLSLKEIDKLFNSKNKKNECILIDVKGIKSIEEVSKFGYQYWRL